MSAPLQNWKQNNTIFSKRHKRLGKSEFSQQESKLRPLVVTPEALNRSYRRLMEAKAITLGPRDNYPVYCCNVNRFSELRFGGKHFHNGEIILNKVWETSETKSSLKFSGRGYMFCVLLWPA